MDAKTHANVDPSVDNHERASSLVIAGFNPFSTADWPDQLVATVLLQGCPWSCTYCNSPGLVDRGVAGQVTWAHVVSVLNRRVGVLDGVVFSGGEPTRQAAVAAAVDAARTMGFKVGLHTSGAYPTRLATLLPKLDWVALDLKAPADRYAAVVGAPSGGERAWESARLIVESGVEYEFRTTVDPVTMSRADIARILAGVERIGGKPPILQEVLPHGTRPEYAGQLGCSTLTSVVPDSLWPWVERRRSR